MGLELELIEVEKNLPTKLSEIWPLVEKARNEVGVAQTQTEMSLGNLQFSGETPITWIQQCYAQAEQKINALHDAYWNMKRGKLKIKRLLEQNTEESLLEADCIESSSAQSEHYIKTAYQDLMFYLRTAEHLRKTHNIPEEIPQELLTENSKKEHIRLSMRQALRDMENHGSISKGVSEHLEHYGVHPATAKALVINYLEGVHDMIKNGKLPSMAHLHEWLDHIENVLLENANDQLKLMKLL